MKKTFRVVAISTNKNAFGLSGVMLMAEDGETWQAGANDLNLPQRMQDVEVEVDDEGRHHWSALGYEIPQRFADKAPPQVLEEVFPEVDPKELWQNHITTGEPLTNLEARVVCSHGLAKSEDFEMRGGDLWYHAPTWPDDGEEC